MQIRVASTLTVYHDGQFWVGMFECVEDGKLSVCKTVFGAEPSNEEVQLLVCEGWNRLRFTKPIAHEGVTTAASNPKRRQREGIARAQAAWPVHQGPAGAFKGARGVCPVA